LICITFYCFRDNKIIEKFFGFKIIQALSNLTKDERNLFDQNAQLFIFIHVFIILKSIISKIARSIFQHFISKLNSFEDIINITKVLKLQFNKDQLYEECIMLKTSY